eukprot:932690_1
MSNSQTLNIDSLVSDPFVAKLHLIRDIGQISLDGLFAACKQSFGETILKRLLTTFCLTQLELISNIDENEISTSLRRLLPRHHETFNPSNPALLDILPPAVLSKCFSFVDIRTLLCSAELVSRDWFHISRLASSISHFPATANIPHNQQSSTLKRLWNACTLHYTTNATPIQHPIIPIDLVSNIDALSCINRVYSDGVLPLFLTKCPATFMQQIHVMEISYALQPIEPPFWTALVDKCHHLRVIKLRNIVIAKGSHAALIKFICSCKNLTVLECDRWRFCVRNMNINGTIKALSERCHLLQSLRIEHCRVSDGVVSHITKLMEYKLRALALVNCNRLKMNSLTRLAQKQEQLYSKNKRLYSFEMDEKMISGAILDHFVGLKSLSIASDHLSGSIAYGVLNRYDSLRDVSIQFRSSIDRLSSHSSSQFDWQLFFKEIGRSLVNFECNCSVIDKARDGKAIDGNVFMTLDGNVFEYITKHCKQLKTLKMSGWKFDSTNKLKKPVRISGRSHSMWGLNNSKNVRNKKGNGALKSKRFDHDFSMRNMNTTVRKESDPAANSGSAMENMMMIPMSNLLQQPHKYYDDESAQMQCLDYMKLEWMFDFGDMPSLNSLNFWCDTVLGLKCTMSMNQELETGSVVILEWNQNWTERYMRPRIICHEKINSKHSNRKNKIKVKTKASQNTKTK